MTSRLILTVAGRIPATIGTVGFPQRSVRLDSSNGRNGWIQATVDSAGFPQRSVRSVLGNKLLIGK